MEALKWWARFHQWATPKAAEQAIHCIEEGAGTIDEIAKLFPKLQHVEAFRDYVAGRVLTGTMPKRRRGQRGKSLKIRRAIIELYALACTIREETPRLSWQAACEAACNRRPEWVPDTWKDGDPAGRLSKEARLLKSTRWGNFTPTQSKKSQDTENQAFLRNPAHHH
ncbi:hypothetical protein ACE0DR_15275 [Azotobacter sp. CWF10]